MTIPRIPALLVACLLTGAVAAATQQTETFPYPVERVQFDNGLTVLLIPMPAEGLVSYWSVVRTGSRDEVEEGVTGFAHFFEHMMFKGTEKLPGPEYERIANGIGADTNAFTSDDLTAYHLGFAAEDLATVIEIEADRFQNLTYDEAEFKTEAGAVYGEYRKGRTSPFRVLFEAMQEAAFDRHTYKHTTMGFEADIARMPEQYDYSRSFFRRFYRPENVVVVVAGDFEPDEAKRLLYQHYRDWAPGYVAPEIPEEPGQTAPRRLDVPFEGQTLPILTVAFKGERLLPTDRTMQAATLIGDLAFGETSPLYRKLVLEEQRVQSLFADFGYNRDPGLWTVIAMVKDPADVPAVEQEIWETIQQLQREPVSSERLTAVRSRRKYEFLSGLTTPGQVCGAVARIVAITGNVNAFDQMTRTLEKVTPKDVRGAAQLYLRRERSTVARLHTAGQPLPESEALTADASQVILRVPADPNVVFKIWFQVGSQDDPPGKEGLAALTAAMLDGGGTKQRSYEQILSALFPLAAGYSVSVDKEMTVATGVVHRDLAAEFYHLFVEALVEPGFREEDFERLRSQAVSRIEKTLRYSSDEELGKAALSTRVFEGTPYGHLDLGTVESLQALTLYDVRSFWRQHFTQENHVVGLGGAIPLELPESLRNALSRLPSGPPAAPPAIQPRPVHGRRVVLVEKSGPSTAISFGYPIDVHRGSREFYALWLANSWLGEHRNSASHLYQVIREARGMNYGDYSYIEAYPNGGARTMPPTGVGRRQQLFEVWIRPVPESQALFALRAALREVELLATNGLTRDQFEFTRDFLKKYSLHFAETTSARLGYAVDDRFYGLDESHLARFRRMMDEVTHEEVNAAISKYLQANDLVIAMVTADAQAMKEKIVADAPSPMDYGDIAKPAEVLEEDRIIERYPLRVAEGAIEIIAVDDLFQRSSTAEQ